MRHATPRPGRPTPRRRPRTTSRRPRPQRSRRCHHRRPRQPHPSRQPQPQPAALPQPAQEPRPELERPAEADEAHKARERRIVRERNAFFALSAGGALLLAAAIYTTFWGQHIPVKFTQRWAFYASLVIMLLLTAFFHGLLVRVLQARSRVSRHQAERDKSKVVRFRRSGLKALLVGEDGRVSTSQVQVVMWTYAILYAAIALLLLGHSPNCPAPGLRTEYWGLALDCPTVNAPSGLFPDAFGERFPAEYLVLLGLPLAAAVAAKKIRTDKEQDPGIEMPPENTNPKQTGVPAGLSEIVTTDYGEVAVLDFQYFMFNLFALAYFFTQLLTHPEAGLPEIPSALLVLAGVSSASYAAAKRFGDPRKPPDEDEK